MPIYRGSGGSGNSNTNGNANQVAADAAAAAASAAAALVSQNAALASELEAESAETNAKISETNAASSATTATTKASEAATSATNAAASATTATTQATTATTQATIATTKASEASTSASNAASSESTATTKAAEASTSATNASNSATASASSATASANSATASANSATASAASAAAAQAAQEAIDGLYLGAQASDPTVDLNGVPVTVGDWYFNTTINKSKIYNGSSWDVLTANGSVTSVAGAGTVNGLTLTGTVTTAGSLTLGGTLSGITASQLNSQNISQWTNDSGYTTNTGTVTPSSTDTFTNKSGNISQWTNDSGYITSYTETDTLDSVTGRGATTTNAITVGNLTSTGIDDNATSNAITISSSQDTTFAGSVTATGAVLEGTDDSILALRSTDDGPLYMEFDRGTDRHAYMGFGGSGDNFRIWNEESAGIIQFGTNNTQAVLIDASQNVDITGNLIAGDGTDTDMSPTSNGQLKIDGNGYDGAIALNATGMHIYHNSSSRALIFGTNETERMRIAPNGDVGIGTTAPSTDFEVQQTTNSPAINIIGDPSNVTDRATIGFNYGSNTGFIVGSGLGVSSNDFYIYSNYAGATRFVIDNNGNVGIGTTTPAGKQHTALATSHTWGNAWGAGTAVFGGAGSINGALGVSYNDTDGAVLGAIAPGVAWKPVALYGSEFIFGISGTENARIDASGKLALTAPSGGLQLRTGTGTQDAYIDWQFNTTTTNFIRMGIDYDTRTSTGWMVDSGYPITLDYTTSLVFKESGTEEARLDVNGNLMVGRTSPTSSVVGHYFLAGGKANHTASNTEQLILNRINTTGGQKLMINFLINGGSGGGITTAGGGTPQFSSASDIRLKDNVTDHESELASVMSLRPVRWNWKDDNLGLGEGFVAQELEQTAWSDLVSEGDDGYKQVSGLGVVETRLIKAIQEQQAMIETLQAQVADLQGAN